jgi:copper chaperone CopZ
MESTKLHIDGMTCDGCVRVVTRALTGLKGVTTTRVDLEHGTADVAYDETRIQPPRFLQALDEVGYEATIAF